MIGMDHKEFRMFLSGACFGIFVYLVLDTVLKNNARPNLILFPGGEPKAPPVPEMGSSPESPSCGK